MYGPWDIPRGKKTQAVPPSCWRYIPGSIPPELCITVEKPDIVIQDKTNKFIHLFELSVPMSKMETLKKDTRRNLTNMHTL